MMPVCFCLAANRISNLAGRDNVFSGRVLCGVAVFGLLPDLCTPHLSLEARFTSWSHTLWFIVALIPVAIAAGFPLDRNHRVRTAVILWLAVLLHLVADAVSGGIPWLYPWSDEVIGDYYIHPAHWIWYDTVFILGAWFLGRVMPYYMNRRGTASGRG